MTKTFIFYSDPGHGWLRVSVTDLRDVGLKTTDFSAGGTYVQFRTSSSIFLEEDCDAPQFIAAYEAKHGERPTIVEKYIDNRNMIGVH